MSVSIAKSAFVPESEQMIGQFATEVVFRQQHRPGEMPMMASLRTPKNQEKIVAEVRRKMGKFQGSLDDGDNLGVKAVEKSIEIMIQQTIDIPRISVVPAGEVKSGCHQFSLDLSVFRQPVPTEDLWCKACEVGTAKR